MKKEEGYFLRFLLLFVVSTTVVAAATTIFDLKKSDFPPGFVFGAGSSALQVEGAVLEDGRKQSIWDSFTHSVEMTISDNSTADITADQYHHYKEDVKLMNDMGLDAYRFSISWSRLIPDGRGPVNPKGLQYYNNLIDELLSYGIQPHVTLYHFDLPQALQVQYEGLLSPRFIEDYTAYANVCFEKFGDRVKNWVTFNEPNLEPLGGYDDGSFPPQRCSNNFGRLNCTKGDSTKEPYIVAHNMLLSHLSASMLYKETYKALQGGKIGITVAAFWFVSFTSLQEDIAAANRMLDFHIGWIVNPLVYGDYPTVMKERVGSRLPSFSFEDSSKLKYSYDFIGINHYGVNYVKSIPNNFKNNERDYSRDIAAFVVGLFRNGGTRKVFALRNISPFNYTAPCALEKLLDYFKAKYGNPPILIHENGYGEIGILPTSTNGTNDVERVRYLQEYIKRTLQSVRNGSNTTGYFVWSLLDCFELLSGYTTRFGLFGVDFKREDRRRYPRLSAHWYAEFLNSNRLRTRASNVMHVV